LDYIDKETNERFFPQVIETSFGIERLIVAIICSAYEEDEINGNRRTYLSFHPKIAPVKVAVLPLVKNNEALVKVARELFSKLQKKWNVSWDSAGSMGRRYRRADEVGVPYCVCVDFDTLVDETVTVRDRDSTGQTRVHMNEVPTYLSKIFDD